MSLSGTLYTAASGLKATQSMSSVTANNIANAMTEGYTRRDAVLVSTTGGIGGVQVAEIRREVDAALVRMSRNETSNMAQQQAVYEGLRDYTLFLGSPGDGTSPAEKFAEFNASLTTLVNLPSSNGAQQGVVYAAEEFATSIRDASDRLASMRADVDMEIRYEVADLNEKLYELKDLNLRLRDFVPGSSEAASFHDQVAGILDEVAGITDIRVSYNADGWVNVYTTGGAALLEGDRVQDVSYTPGDGTFYAGTQEITPGVDGVRGVESGSLAGFATLKRETIPTFQLQLDEYARSVMQAFETADASLSAGEAGLFTDNGFAFDAANLEGLASRFQVNESLHEGVGGSAWRVRDGLSATTQGEASSVIQIQAFIDVLNQESGVDPTTGLNTSVSIADLGAEIISAQGTESARAEGKYNAAASAAEVIQASRSSVEGVNIDEEMQNLIMIEQSFVANSKMLTAVAEMFDTLLAAV